MAQKESTRIKRLAAQRSSAVSASARVMSPSARRTVIIAFAFSGMAALMYEVLWTRELSLVFGSTVYAVSMMLAAFMSGLSLGAFLGGRWADRTDNPVALFAKLEFGIGILGLLTLVIVQALPGIYFAVFDATRPPFAIFFLLQMALSFLVMLAPTTLMGATFPVVTKIATFAIDEVGQDVGTVYSVNTLGSIAGSLGTGFLLIPLLGVKATTVAAACVNIAVAAVVWWASGKRITSRLVTVGAVLLVAALALALTTQQAAFAHNFYRIGDFATAQEYRAYRDSLHVRFFADDVHGRVVVLQEPGGDLLMQNSGKVEGSTGPLDLQTTSLLARLPMASASATDTVLVIGLGTGFTARAALAGGAGTVDTVEINDAVVEASRLFVGDAVDSDPRHETHVTDARNYLELADTRYDVITSEPSYPLSTHVSHLFTREFYQLVESRLSDDGVFCQWIPRYLLRDEDTLMMLKTFTAVFPNTHVWGSNQGEDEAVDLLLIGIKGECQPDPAVVQAAVLAAIGPVDFSYYAGPDEVAAATSDASVPLNTDDRPLLEFRTPRNQVEFYREGLEGLRRN
ncbi:MAG: spermidine synthase [Coriobacteriia bacterium]